MGPSQGRNQSAWFLPSPQHPLVDVGKLAPAGLTTASGWGGGGRSLWASVPMRVRLTGTPQGSKSRGAGLARPSSRRPGGNGLRYQVDVVRSSKSYHTLRYGRAPPEMGKTTITISQRAWGELLNYG